MLDAEMEVVDRRPTGLFNFDLDRYKEQLVAGYSLTLPDMVWRCTCWASRNSARLPDLDSRGVRPIHWLPRLHAERPIELRDIRDRTQHSPFRGECTSLRSWLRSDSSRCCDIQPMA